MFTAIQMVVEMYQNMYPNAKDSWIRRAAEDSISWAKGNPNPSNDEIEAQDKRIHKLCTTGKLYS